MPMHGNPTAMAHESIMAAETQQQLIPMVVDGDIESSSAASDDQAHLADATRGG